MSVLSKDFLWGGAAAAHQLEGGWQEGRGERHQCSGCDDSRSQWRYA